MVGGTHIPERGIELLLSRRISALIEDENVLNYYPTRHPEEAAMVRFTGKLRLKPFFMAFEPARAESVELERTFDEGMTTIQHSGKLVRIFARYGLEPEPSPNP